VDRTINEDPRGEEEREGEKERRGKRVGEKERETYFDGDIYRKNIKERRDQRSYRE
jgi:hypothetical protein